ncbi:MAG: radical SAM protein [Desulfarculaceae bacterium]|nr:radical SAM protein [Desulfarculaceae bacterium]
MYKYLFGPVPSRRLGISLGVDLVYHKVCSLDCVYCECGRTTQLTGQRAEYVPVEEVKQELDRYFSSSPDPDYITFSGSGEPTLHSGIGTVIDFIRERKQEVSVAVLTNGTLLSLKEVRQELMNADLIIPSLDAADAEIFRKINRPCDSLDIRDYIEGIRAMKAEFSGKLWLEILILPGYNDTEEGLLKLKEAAGRIQPDKIQLNTLDRPGTRDSLTAAPPERLKEIAAFFEFDNMEIIAAYQGKDGEKDLREDMADSILETVQRRPCTLEDLSNILGARPAEISKFLSDLENRGMITVLHQERGIFYKASGTGER